MLLALFAVLFAGPEADRITPPSIEAPAVAAGADDDDDAGDDGESESATAEATGPDIRYTKDLSDEQLASLWKDSLAQLGTISVGFADNGRLINAVHMGVDRAWMCQRPDLAWGTQETIDSLERVFRAVHEQFPMSAPARLSHIGNRDGGYLRPHHSHQSGRDADIAFFYKNDVVPQGRMRREKLIDPARNWALVKALVTETDVQVILTDRGIQKVLKDYALASGEDAEWVSRVFRPGKHALVQHAKRHKDHFHVRFFAPRSQELGRRVQPLLAQRPDQNLVLHRVKRGQTLGHIAKIYGTSVKAIQVANHMRKVFLHLNQQLAIPLRKACTKCPLPPPVVVPPRCLPGTTLASAAAPAPAAE